MSEEADMSCSRGGEHLYKPWEKGKLVCTKCGKVIVAKINTPDLLTQNAKLKDTLKLIRDEIDHLLKDIEGD